MIVSGKSGQDLTTAHSGLAFRGVPWQAAIRFFARPEAFGRCISAASALILLSVLFLSAAPAEKQLSVYSTAANYSLTLVQRNGRDYVGLLELLEPLGAVT